MYCIRCGSELSDGQVVCPICNTRVYHPDIELPEEKPTYPKKDFKSEEFNKKGLMFVVTVLFLIPLLLPMLLELNWHGEIGWSGYVTGGTLLFYVCFVLPAWFKRTYPAIFYPTSFAAITLYLLYVCIETEGDWFMSFAMPITLTLGAIISAAAILIHYLRRGILYIIGGAIIALGFWCGLLDALSRVAFDITTELIWSTFPIVFCFIIGMMLIIIEIVKPFKESLRKIFFIG